MILLGNFILKGIILKALSIFLLFFKHTTRMKIKEVRVKNHWYDN